MIGQLAGIWGLILPMTCPACPADVCLPISREPSARIPGWPEERHRKVSIAEAGEHSTSDLQAPVQVHAEARVALRVPHLFAAHLLEAALTPEEHWLSTLLPVICRLHLLHPAGD